MTMDQEIVDRASDLVRRRMGFEVPRFYRERLKQGLLEAQAAVDAASIEATLAALGRLPCDGPGWQAVVEAITIGETNFLRHVQWFNEIKECVLRPLVERRRQQGVRRVDLWSAGCSTGEEPYTLAIIMDELLPDRGDWVVRILGTDINGASLAAARRGVYREWALRELDDAQRARSFSEAEPQCYRIAPHLREMVEFRNLNLCENVYPDPARGLHGFDLIICRNVMIYLSETDRQRTAQRLARSLGRSGWLAVSPAEAVAEWYRPLRPVNRPTAILFCNEKRVPKAAKPKPPRPAVVAPAHHYEPPPLPEPPAAPEPSLPASSTTADPAQADALLARARAFADAGDLGEARQCCVTALADSVASFDAYLLLAAVCLELGDPGTALEAARCASYLNPDCGAAHYMLGTSLNRLGDVGGARRRMAVAVQLLEAMPKDAPVAAHFGATAGELCESARGFHANPAAA